MLRTQRCRCRCRCRILAATTINLDSVTQNVQFDKLDKIRLECQGDVMSSTTKADQILDASLAVFCRYGFAKTTMKDLAEAAGISRATLYMNFSNKEDVFRAGSQRAHAMVLADVESVLNTEGPVIERIDKAMTAYLQGLMEEISASPHGQELFASNLALSGDLTHESRRHVKDRITEVLAEAALTGEIVPSALDTTPAELASLILATVEGIKAAGGVGTQISDGSSLFMRILGAAVSP